jgi:hypothetical protein
MRQRVSAGLSSGEYDGNVEQISPIP